MLNAASSAAEPGGAVLAELHSDLFIRRLIIVCKRNGWCKVVRLDYGLLPGL